MYHLVCPFMKDFREHFCTADAANHAPITSRITGENTSENQEDPESGRLYQPHVTVTKPRYHKAAVFLLQFKSTRITFLEQKTNLILCF